MAETENHPDLVGELRELRFGYSDEVPEGIVGSTAENNKYKVRKGWFLSIIFTCYSLLAEHRISAEEGKKAAEEIMERFSREDFKGPERLTKKEDIEEANRLIDIILSEL